ncbi:MAG: tetratricopeptide repeat protein [Planctomycetota bacterium]|nr:tetratricopeptide repeat protein [Planctomycetota bacterium]
MRERKVGIFVVLVLMVLSEMAFSQETPDVPEVSEYDYLFLKGISKPLVGVIVKTTEEFYYVKLRDYASETEMPIKKSDVVKVVPRQSPEEALKARLKRAQPTPDSYLAVAKWALGYPELYEATKGILVSVVKMRPQKVEPYLMLLNFIEQDCAEKGRPMTEGERNILLDALEAALSFNHPLLVTRYGMMLVELGLSREAFSLLKGCYDSLAAQTSAPHRRMVELALIEVAVGMEKYESARQVLDKLLKREPDCCRALLFSARIALENGKLDEAKAVLEKLKEKEPLYWEVFSLLGAVEFAKGNLGAAEENFLTAARLRKPDDSLLLDLSQVLIMNGKVFTAQEKLQEVSNKSGWRFNYLSGLASIILEESKEVIRNWLKKSCEAPDAVPFVFQQYATFLLSIGEAEEAVKWAKRSLESGYEPAEALRLIGFAYRAKGEIKTAERYFLYSLSAAPQDADTLCLLADVAIFKRRYDEALRYLTEALTAKPEHLNSLKSCAYLNYLLNRFDEAQGYIERASAVASNDPYILRFKKSLDEVSSLLCWRELFKRADSVDVANGWAEEGENLGIEIKIKGENLVMEGNQKDNGDILLTRAESLKSFVRFEAAMDFSGALEANCGLKVLVRDAKGNLQAWIAFWRDFSGKFRYNYSGSGGIEGELKEIPDVGVSAEKAKLAIELDDPRNSLWKFYLDGEMVGEVKAESFMKRAGGGNVFVAVYGRAAAPKRWSLICDYVHIFRRKKE